MSYCSVEDVAKALQIRPDSDPAGLQRAVDAAADMIDADLDRDDPLPDPAPASITQANIALAVETYKLPGTPFGVAGYDQTGAVRIARDLVPRYWALLTPYKQGWSIA